LGTNAKKARTDRKGIGLYTYEQTKNITAFQYFAQLIIGAIIVVVGGMLLYRVFIDRAEESRRYQSAETHVWPLAAALAIVGIGLFMAHAGVIFYARKIVRLAFLSPKFHGRKLRDRSSDGD
jgi:hypothetical protein